MSNQILNIHYKQSLSPELLNSLYQNLFYAGVIQGTFSYNSNSLIFSNLSFLINPQNRSDLTIRIDTTSEVIKIKSSPTDTMLIARYYWENNNKGAGFLFVDSNTKLEHDIILMGLLLDETGNIVGLNEDVQERARLKLITTTTAYPLIAKLDGYLIGHSNGTIPINDKTLNVNLNTEMVDNKKIEEYIVSKELSSIESIGDIDIIIEPIIPEWMNSDKVDEGEGVTTEFLNNKKIQPQDGITKPGNDNQIPIANNILQKDLNIEQLNGKKESLLAKKTHSHSLDDITDGGNPSLPDYYRVLGVEANQITADSIESDSIGYQKFSTFAYDVTQNLKYTPIFESGSITMAGNMGSVVNFTRPMRNARIFLQKEYPIATGVPGWEKRGAYISNITTTLFITTQFCGIEKNGVNYQNTAGDIGAQTYYYIAIGEAI